MTGVEQMEKAPGRGLQLQVASCRTELGKGRWCTGEGVCGEGSSGQLKGNLDGHFILDWIGFYSGSHGNL